MPNYEVRWDNQENCQVYRFEQIVNCSIRKQEPEQNKSTDTANEESVKIETSNQEVESDDDIIHSVGSESEGSLVSQVWRLISAVQAWPCSDFPYPQLVDYSYQEGNKLKALVNLVNMDKPDLLWNHSNDVHDVAGFVSDAYWEPSIDIPYGVNAKVNVDRSFDPKAAVGIEKGFIRNGSIGIVMDCKPSHESMKFSEFIENQGKEVNGDVVRWLPVNIISVRHMAMVAAGTGADPFAGRRTMSNTKTETEVITENIEQIETDKQETINAINEQKEHCNGEDGLMVDYVALLSDMAKGLGVDVALSEEGELPEGLSERLQGKISKLSGIVEKYNALCAKVEDIEDAVGLEHGKDIIEVLKAKLSFAAYGEKLLDHYRKEATRWFDSAKVALGRNELSDSEKRMRNRIVKSEDLDYLEDIVAEYREITESTLSNKRVSEGVELPKDKRVEMSQKEKDIEASVKALFESRK